MENLVGVKEMKELLKLVVGIGNAVGKSLEDKKMSADDMGNFVSCLMLIGPAVEGIGKLPAEMKDIQPAELDELVNFCNDELKIPQDKIKHIIEQTLIVLGAAGKIALVFKKEPAPVVAPAAPVA